MGVKLLSRHFLMMLVLIGYSFHSYAQEESDIGKQVTIALHDGTLIHGELRSLTDTTLIVNVSALGDLTIIRSEIKKWNLGGVQVDQGLDPSSMDTYNSTIYLINPSGYTLKKGQSYYQNIGVFINSYSVGVTDRFSITGGLELISPLYSSRFPSLYFSPRYSIPFGDERGALSIGATGFLYVESGSDLYLVGLAQAALTIGNRNNNLTFGSGIGFTGDDGFGTSAIPFNLSGMTRISRRLSLVTDNFILASDNFNNYAGLLSLGLRLHFKNQAAFNVGLWRPLEDGGIDNILGIPFISLLYPIK